MNRDANNFKAGLFVLIGLGLIAAMVIVLTDIDRLFAETRPVVVRFPLSDGLQGLKLGAIVTVGDVPGGEVVEIADVAAAGQPQVVVAKDVRFTIPAQYKLFDNAQIELVVPPLGSGTKLNIRGFGRDAGELETDEAGNARAGKSWVYEDGEVIRGGIAGSTLTANLVKDMGIEDAQRLQIQGIIADVKVVTGALARDPQALEQIVTNARDLTAQLKTDLPQIAANLKKTSEDLQVVMADVRGRYTQWLDRIDAITSAAETALATVNGMLEENRPVMKSTLAKAESTLDKADKIAAEVQSQWLTKVNTMLATADASLEHVKVITADLRMFVTAQLPVLDRAMANMRLTSDQLKLASIEVRRSPWRLLYTPTDQELESDNIYDAARSFALAAGDLESTANSLQAVMQQQGGSLDAADAKLKLMLENLHQTFEKFMEAENKFWDAMTPPAAGQ